MNAIRIVLADDHGILRSGVRSLLEDLDDMEVVGEAADGLAALVLLARLRPDVLISDIKMPRLGGLELAARAAAEHPDVKVVILSMYDDREYVRGAIAAGASGYLLKDTDEVELAAAIRAVHRGETYLSPGAAGQLVADYVRLGAPPEPASGRRLTPRQLDVLRLIAEGLTTKAIAYRLGISTKTVEAHRAQLMNRLGIHELANLVRYAVRAGLLDERG